MVINELAIFFKFVLIAIAYTSDLMMIFAGWLMML